MSKLEKPLFFTTLVPMPTSNCLLCGGKPSLPVDFVVLDEKYGVPPGKVRHIFYNLCEKCFQTGVLAASRVEKFFENEFKKPSSRTDS